MTKKELMEKAETLKSKRSAWARGVGEYVDELIGSIYWREDIPEDWREFKEMFLNGAESFKAYSWGGMSLIYNGDIANRLCSPSEFAKTRGGMRRPNSREDWLDVQGRALYQAYLILKRAHSELLGKIVY